MFSATEMLAQRKASNYSKIIQIDSQMGLIGSWRTQNENYCSTTVATWCTKKTWDLYKAEEHVESAMEMTINTCWTSANT